MNIITISGRIGKDAELRHTQSGKSVANFSVADDQGRDRPAIWWPCHMWGERGEKLAQYLRKGGHVTVVGDVTEREWQDKDGQTRKSMDVRVINVALQGGRNEAQADPSPRASASPRPAESGPGNADEDIPF